MLPTRNNNNNNNTLSAGSSSSISTASEALSCALGRGWKGQVEAAELLLAIACAAPRPRTETSAQLVLQTTRTTPATRLDDRTHLSSTVVLPWSFSDLPAVRDSFQAAANSSLSWTSSPSQAPGELLAYPYAVLAAHFPEEPDVALDAAEFLVTVGRHEDALSTIQGVYARASLANGPPVPVRAAVLRMSALTAMDDPDLGRAPVVDALATLPLTPSDRVYLLEELILHLMCVRPHLPPAADLALFTDWTLDALPEMIASSFGSDADNDDGNDPFLDVESGLDRALFPVVSLALRCLEAQLSGLAGALLCGYVTARQEYGGSKQQALDSLVKDMGPLLVSDRLSPRSVHLRAVLTVMNDPSLPALDSDGNDLPEIVGHFQVVPQHHPSSNIAPRLSPRSVTSDDAFSTATTSTTTTTSSSASSSSSSSSSSFTSSNYVSESDHSIAWSDVDPEDMPADPADPDASATPCQTSSDYREGSSMLFR